MELNACSMCLKQLSFLYKPILTIVCSDNFRACKCFIVAEMYITHNIPHLCSELILTTNKKGIHIFIVCYLRHLTSYLIISECAVYLIIVNCWEANSFQIMIQDEIPDLVTWADLPAFSMVSQRYLPVYSKYKSDKSHSYFIVYSKKEAVSHSLLAHEH